MMKKVYLVLLAMVSIFLFTSVAVAQGSTATSGNTPAYVVQKGDTLWWLEGYYRGDPSQWKHLVDENQFLKKPGRIFTKEEKTIVLIRPGEQLKGLVELGILPKEVPLSALQISKQSAWNTWYILLSLAIGLAIAMAILGLYRLRRIFSDPATSGQPIIRGGLFADRPRDIEGRFQRIAEARIASGDPIPQRIGPIEEGFLSGYGRVQYRDRSEMRRLNREPAYRARFRFHNGTEKDLFFLQRCANDVILYNTRYLGFIFEPTHQVVPEPQATQTQAGRAPLRVAVAGEGLVVAVTKFRINDLEITVPEGSTFSVTGEKITISISRAGDIAIDHAKKAKRTKAVRPVAAVS